MKAEQYSVSPQLYPAEVAHDTFALYKKYFAAILIGGVLSTAASYFLKPETEQAYFGLAIVSILLFEIIQILFLRYLYIREHKKHQAFTDFLITSAKYIVPGVFISLTSMLINTAGFLLLIVPGLIWSAMFSQALNMGILEGRMFKEAFQASYALTKGNLLKIMYTYIIIFLPYILLTVVLALFVPELALNNTLSAVLSVLTNMLLPLSTYGIYKSLKKLHA